MSQRTPEAELISVKALERPCTPMPTQPTLRVGSFCSGIAAPEVAWRGLGWQPQFFSEIDPFASAVLNHRHPGVRNLGNMEAVLAALVYGPRVIRRRMRKGKGWESTRDWLLEIVRLLDATDLWVAGTPCQAFSVAGLRESLSDARGNLTLMFVELIHAINPRIVVWENVPGVLSTKDNAFGCFLAGLVGEGEPLVCGDGSWPDAGMVVGPRRSAAWRVLDAQFFKLAQRRRRVFVVSFRTRDGINPGAVLFEPDRVPRHSPPSREAGTRVAASLTRGAGPSGPAGRRQEDDVNIVTGTLNCGGGNGGFRTEPGEHIVGCLNANGKAAGSATQQDAEAGMLVAHSLRAECFDASEDGTGRGTPIVPVTFGWQNSEHQGDSLSEHITPTLDKSKTPAIAYGIHSDALDRTGEGAGGTAGERAGLGISENLSPCINAKRPNAVAFAQKQRDEIRVMDVAGALAAEPGMKQQTYVAPAGMAVRRLTPTECERLQGFPDSYTLIPYRGKPAADGPRYRALGNSMAVPVLRWIGERIAAVDGLTPTGPSLAK